MKIIFTVNKYKPNLDGVQFVTSYLAEGLVKKGHDVSIVTSIHTRIPSKEEEVIEGVNVYRKDIRTSHTFHIGNKKEYQKFILELSKNADCLINVGSQSPFTDWLFDIFDEIKIPKILYLHSIWDFKYHKENFDSLRSICFKVWANIRWKLYYTFNKKIFAKYDKIVQLHKKDYSYEFFKKKYGIDSCIIENAAANDFFDDKINPKFEKPFDKYLIYVANYIDRKNQILAVDAFLKSNIDENIGLVLIGSSKTNYYDKLVKYIDFCRRKYNLSATQKPIKVLYNIDRELISSYVKKSNLYLLTSKDEKYPISIIESMAASIPYISTDVGVVKYLPGGITSSWKDLKFWIEELLNDETLRKDMGICGKNFALKNMTIDKKVDQLEKIIISMKGGK